MEMDMSEYLDEFVKELHQLLDKFEYDLEKISSGKEDKAVIDEIFRAAHSIKGMSAAMEFKNMEGLTHRMEDLLDKIRNSELNINSSILQTLFKGVKLLNELLRSIEYNASEDDVEQKNIDEEVMELDNILGKKEEKKIETSLEVVFDENIKNQVEKLLNKKNHVFFSQISLDEKSPLITARAFMVVSSLKNNEELIYSSPRLESFTKANFDLEGNKLRILFASEKPLDELKHFISTLPEVNNILIKPITSLEKLNLDFSTKQEIPLFQSEEQNNEEVDLFSKFESEEEVLKELNKRIGLIEEMAVEASSKNFVEFFKEVLPKYTIVVRGIQLLEIQILSDLADKSLNLLNYCSDSLMAIQDECVDCFLDILMYLKKFCDNKTIINNKIFKAKLFEYNKKMDKMLSLKDIQSDDKIGSILQKQLNMPDQELNELLEKQKNNYPGKKLGEVAIAEKKLTSKDVVSALRVQNAQKKQSDLLQEQIRIPAQKADQLIDLLEELIMVESETEQDAILLTNEDSKLLKNINKCFRITKEIQTLSISFRMITLHSIFQKVNMSARDAMKKLDKKIKFEISGSQTNIDRLVGNKLVDPLLHLIKNSISHGIEHEDEREAKGKPREGNVYITAYSEKGYVYISIADDGRGMDVDTLYQKALDKNLIDPNKKFTNDEILNFIFLPGFSTAETINKISGRGVGMDVVKTEIQKLRGKISISNRPGKGCTTVLRIPQNMTSLNGTVVKIKGNKYIIPSIYIKEVFKLEEEKFVTISGENNFVKLRNSLIPVINRDIFFHGEGEPEIMVVLDVDSLERALPIDQVMERREIVVKPLGEDFEDINYIAGASILGDGKAALIIGIENLFKLNDEHNIKSKKIN